MACCPTDDLLPHPPHHQVCLAMQYVHRQGILHRDLKGSNIFLTGEGIIKLGDFGISKVPPPLTPSCPAGVCAAFL